MNLLPRRKDDEVLHVKKNLVIPVLETAPDGEGESDRNFLDVVQCHKMDGWFFRPSRVYQRYVLKIRFRYSHHRPIAMGSSVLTDFL